MKKYIISKTIASALLTVFMAVNMAGCSTNSQSSTTVPAKSGNTGSQGGEQQFASTNVSTQNTKAITVVWYPNESANDFQGARDELSRLIEEATGRKVVNSLTTDYTIAIESLASGAADIGALMGAQGYIEAKNRNPQVDVLFVNSGASGTLDDAIYYSWICVNKGEESNYKDGSAYSIANIQGKKMSFVSNSSTSGFKIPTNNIIKFFSNIDPWKNINIDDLIEGGSNAFFSEVLFGGSHQGSAFNLLSGKADAAAFCDTELAPYTIIKEGEEEKAGSVYAVKDDATAPFDTVTGKEFVIIQSTPVLNGPYAYNPKNLSESEIQSIRDLFTSDAVVNNPLVFASSDSSIVGLHKKTDKERYVLVDDSWYNPIREMGN